MHSQNPLESRDRPRPLSRDPEKGQADEAVGGRRGLAAQLRCRGPGGGGQRPGLRAARAPPSRHFSDAATRRPQRAATVLFCKVSRKECQVV